MTSTIQVLVRGMDCNRCKTNVVNNLSRLPGILTVNVDLDRDLVTLIGESIDLQKVKSTVEGIGYKYEEIGQS